MKRRFLQLTQKTKHPGQGLVELALVLPIFLLLLIGIIEVGRLVYTYSAVYSASQDGARYGGTLNNYQDGAGICAHAINAGVGIGLTTANITISYDQGPTISGQSLGLTQGTVGNCTTSAATLQAGDRVIVSVSKGFTFFIPFSKQNWGPTITSTSYRTIISGVDTSSSLPPTATQ